MHSNLYNISYTIDKFILITRPAHVMLQLSDTNEQKHDSNIFILLPYYTANEIKLSMEPIHVFHDRHLRILRHLPCCPFVLGIDVIGLCRKDKHN